MMNPDDFNEHDDMMADDLEVESDFWESYYDEPDDDYYPDHDDYQEETDDDRGDY